MSGLSWGQYPSRVLTHRLDALGDVPGMGLGLSQLNGQLLHGLKGSVLVVLKCLEVHTPIILLMTWFRATGYDCVGC